MYEFPGLNTVNIELTNRCNKSCWMCGRRRIEPDPCDIDFKLLKLIADQLPPNIIIQFHNNGESLLYDRFGEAVQLFNRQIKCMNTNGKLLLEKADEIIDNLDTITISIIENDKEVDQQYFNILHFLEWKKERKPRVIFRMLGNVDEKRYKKFNCLIAKRILHSSMGSFNYKKKVTIPEHGICLDLLSHLSIAANGQASICVRFDPEGYGVIGNAKYQSLKAIWNSKKRTEYIMHHIKGERDKVKLCSMCDFYGVPTC